MHAWLKILVPFLCPQNGFSKWLAVILRLFLSERYVVLFASLSWNRDRLRGWFNPWDASFLPLSKPPAGIAPQWRERSPPTNVFPGSIPGPGVICGLRLLLVLYSASWDFFSGYSCFPLSSKTNISKLQFDPGIMHEVGISERVFVTSLLLRR